MLKIRDEDLLTLLSGLASIYLYLSGLGLYFKIATYLSYLIYPVCYGIGIISYFKIINHRYNIFAIITCFLFLLINFAINPFFNKYAVNYSSFSTFLLSDAMMISFISIPVFFLSRKAINYERLFKCFVSIGLTISVLFCVLFFLIVFVHKDTFDYMNIAYGVLPWLLYVIAYSIKTREKIYVIISIIDMFMVLISGCRGAAVTLFAFLVLISIWLIRQSFNYRKLIVLCLLAIGVVALIVNINSILEILYYQLAGFGFKSRTLELILGLGYETGIGHYSDRASIQKQMLEQVNLFGHGIYSDRSMVIPGVYAHNLLLEWLLDFGVVFGGILSLLFIALAINGIIRVFASDSYPFVIIIASCISILCCKYMVSSSYLHSPEFWLLFGLLTTCFNIRKHSVSSES